MTTREQAARALLAELAKIAPFRLVSRRLIEPTEVGTAESPALFLVEAGEATANVAPQTPPKRILKYAAVIVNRVAGDDLAAVPAAAVNDALDALDALLRRLGDPTTGRVTLGGLVFHVRVEGETVKAPGETTGLALAAAPIEIVMP